MDLYYFKNLSFAHTKVNFPLLVVCGGPYQCADELTLYNKYLLYVCMCVLCIYGCKCVLYELIIE